MKKTITQRFFLSLCLMIVGCLWGNSAWAETVTYQHVFNAAPKTGNSVTLTGVAWNIDATNLGAYQSSYRGVQIGAGGKTPKAGEIKLTSSSDWSYKSKTKITEVRLWLNTGGKSVTPTVTIGGKSAISDGTSITKNSGISSWSAANKVTFTPAPGGNTGVIVIDVTSVNAGYICAIEIDCEEAPTLSSVAVTGTPTKKTYEEGDVFDPAGLVVTATYSDGSTEAIKDGITWNFNHETLTEGLTSVTVKATVDGVTSPEFEVTGLTVTAARTLSSVTLEGNPTKTTYIVGETFDPTGIKVMANYTTGDPKDVTDEATIVYDDAPLTFGTAKVDVVASYKDKDTDVKSYTITVLKTIVPFAPKVIYRKITSTADIVDGGQYVIVYAAGKKGLLAGASKVDDQTPADFTFREDGKTIAADEVQKMTEITFELKDEATYYMNIGDKYIKSTTSTALSVATGKDDAAAWEIGFDAEGNVEINSIKNTKRGILYSSTSNAFKNYDYTANRGNTGYPAIQLYQKVGEISVAKATGGITTFASNYDYVMPEHLTGYIVTAAKEEGTMTTKVAYRAGENVPAYTPLIIKSSEDYTEEETSKTYTPVALNKGLRYTDEKNLLEYNRDAYGFTKATESESVYYYKLAKKGGNVGFYWGAEGGAAFQMTKPSTAYLTVPQILSVQGFVLNLEEGETTGITTVVTDENAPIYNLQGIRMNGKNLPKGIYIQGGKKFMVK